MARYFSTEETYARVKSLKFYKDITSVSAPKHLFHYTSSAGLLGIVSSATMWMSDSKSLNDEKELRYFKDIVELAAENLCNNAANSELSEAYKDIVARLGRYAHVVTGGIFVLSFSEHRDQLSQWRAYSGKSPGYSLGIPGNRLGEVASQSGFFICKCCYDYQTAYRAACSLLAYFTGDFLANEGKDLDDQSADHEFGRMVNILAPLFKNPSFSEEAEWRVYDFLSWQDTRLQFREAAGEIIPYVTFPLTEIRDRLSHEMPDSFVIVPGPGQR